MMDFENEKNITIFTHPLIQHKISILRDKKTGTNEFRKLVEEIAMLEGFEALSDLPTEDVEIETPIETCMTPMISGRKLAIVPILRAGLGMVPGVLSLVPTAKVGHIGMYRNEETHEPVPYYCKLPHPIEERTIVVTDPMLATGGSAVDAIDQIKKVGGKQIKFMCIIAAPEGVEKLHKAHPDVQIYIGHLDRELNGRTPDYLVISHLEPDHASNIKVVSEKYPSMKLVGNAKTFSMLPQFFPDFDFADKTVTVKEGDELELGSHKLTFIMAPMVHWPEVMVSYESAEKVLFSADGFGTFGALDAQEDDWACEARRYYFNICGKYGVQVQNLLKKTAKLDIRKICPLHGPVLDENLGWYIGLYDTWSKYEPETDGVFIAYCSVHGNTAKAAEKLCEIIKSKTDKKVSIADLSRTDLAEDIEDAFRFSRMVVIAPSYDGGVFPIMNDFLHHLKIKGYKNRKVAMVENGSWAPSAAKTMRTYLEEMKNVEICPTVVTIRSSMKEENIPQLEQLSDEILG